MNRFNYDSYCGIYCGACDIMMAYRSGVRTRLASFWSEKMVRLFRKKMGAPCDREMSCAPRCYGCKSSTLFANCAVCEIRKCAMGKKVDHCIDCGDYPCVMIGDFMKMQTMLPHLGGNRENLETIKSAGVKSWLALQERKWRCPGCGTAFSWYMTRCGSCGKDLREHSFRLSVIRSLVLRFAILLMPAKKK